MLAYALVEAVGNPNPIVETAGCKKQKNKKTT